MPDIKEKLVELLEKHCDYAGHVDCKEDCTACLADHLIANGVTILESNLKVLESATDNNVGCKWISVEERLPEENGRYLCNVESFAFPGCFYQAILQCDRHGFREGNIYTDDVTHWMLLPEPPKGE